MARESQTPPVRDIADSVPSMTSTSTDDAGRLAQMRRALLEQQGRRPLRIRPPDRPRSPREPRPARCPFRLRNLSCGT